MSEVVFRSVKNEVRILGVDDGAFKKFKDHTTTLIGVVYRGGSYLEGVLQETITVDGDDATDRIVEMVAKTRHRGHLRVIMLSGITFGGLNIVDIEQVFAETKLPVIVVTRRLPDIKAVDKAVSRVPNPAAKKERLLKGGAFHRIIDARGAIVIQKTGLTLEDAKEILRLSTVRGLMPEPLRVAHLIASGITTGDSKGRA